MTAQEIIQNALLRVEDTDPSGRTMLQLLSYLTTMYKAMYNFVMSWDIGNISGFEKTRLEFTPDSDGKYALPADHMRTIRMYIDGLERPALYVDYGTMENTTYGTSANLYRWTIYNGYWYLQPGPTSTAIAWYFPKLATLELTTTWPGDGEFDDAAIEFLVTKCLLNDRFGKYDVQAEAGEMVSAMLRTRMAMLHRDPKARIVASPIHAYKAARGH